jgi:hypothetical protein
MPDFSAAIEDYLASMPEADWQALCARVRPPDDNPDEQPESMTPATEFARIILGEIAPKKWRPR